MTTDDGDTDRVAELFEEIDSNRTKAIKGTQNGEPAFIRSLKHAEARYQVSFVGESGSRSVNHPTEEQAKDWARHDNRDGLEVVDISETKGFRFHALLDPTMESSDAAEEDQYLLQHIDSPEESDLPEPQSEETTGETDSKNSQKGLQLNILAREVRRDCIDYYDAMGNTEEAREEIASKLEEMAASIRTGELHL